MFYLIKQADTGCWPLDAGFYKRLLSLFIQHQASSIQHRFVLSNNCDNMKFSG